MTDATTTPTDKAGEPVLLPCPFCGGEASLTQGMGEWWVRCHPCESNGMGSSNRDRAIAAWNRRPALAPPAEGEVSEGGAWYRTKAAIEFAFGSVLEAGCKANGSTDPSYAANDYIIEATNAVLAVRTPTPAPVDWERVGPKLVEAGLAFEAAVTADIPVGDGYSKWVETAQSTRSVFQAALAAAQSQSNGE